MKCTRSTEASDLSRFTPGALAGMRLAGHRRRAQLVAHTMMETTHNYNNHHHRGNRIPTMLFDHIAL